MVGSTGVYAGGGEYRGVEGGEEYRGVRRWCGIGRSRPMVGKTEKKKKYLRHVVGITGVKAGDGEYSEH